MLSSFFSHLRLTFKSVLVGSVVLGAVVGAQQPAQAFFPVLTFNDVDNDLDGSYTNDPPNSSVVNSSFGYFFDLNGTAKVDALGLFAQAQPINWTSGTYSVSLWEYNSADINNLQPSEITLLDTVNFDATNFNNNAYSLQAGYVWQSIPARTLTGTPADPARGYIVGVYGNPATSTTFTNTPVGQLKYLTSAPGLETFNYGFINEGNGANDATDTTFWNAASNPTYAPIYQIFDANNNPINGYFNANISLVPGPLPILGAGAAFSWSRRLRKRVKNLS